MSKRAVIVSAQFLVELPDDVQTPDAESFGIDWLGGLNKDCLDYRHPKIAGIYIRPVPVLIKDTECEELFEESNIIQL